MLRPPRTPILPVSTVPTPRLSALSCMFPPRVHNEGLTLATMTLRPGLRAEATIKVHTPPYIFHYQLPPSAFVQLVQLAQLPEEGEGLHEDIGKAGVGLAE